MTKLWMRICGHVKYSINKETAYGEFNIYSLDHNEDKASYMRSLKIYLHCNGVAYYDCRNGKAF